MGNKCHDRDRRFPCHMAICRSVVAPPFRKHQESQRDNDEAEGQQPGDVRPPEAADNASLRKTVASQV